MFGFFSLTFTHLIFDININLSNSPFDLWLPDIIHYVYIQPINLMEIHFYINIICDQGHFVFH